jgi:hypothetical protein
VGHGIPDFMLEEGKKPVGPYEWSLWALINLVVVVSFLVVLIPMVFIALLMIIVQAICGGGE